jgi:HK97 family phage major capsid protein
LLKAADSGVYLAGGPLASEPTTLWGVPVKVVNRASLKSTVIVGNFKTAGHVYVRQPVTFEMNPWAGQEFSRNEILTRAEERIALGLEQPKAICPVSLT